MYCLGFRGFLGTVRESHTPSRPNFYPSFMTSASGRPQVDATAMDHELHTAVRIPSQRADVFFKLWTRRGGLKLEYTNNTG